MEAMTYSIFDSTGNLVDAFTHLVDALDCFSRIVGAERDHTADVFLFAQDDDGQDVRTRPN